MIEQLLEDRSLLQLFNEVSDKDSYNAEDKKDDDATLVQQNELFLIIDV